MSEYADKGYATAETATPRKGVDHISMSIDDLFEMVTMAEGMADRIAGPVPPPTTAKSALNSVPTSTATTLHDHAERIAAGRRRIRDALNRIDDAI